jgi:hypothetical protein
MPISDRAIAGVNQRDVTVPALYISGERVAQQRSGTSPEEMDEAIPMLGLVLTDRHAC